MGSFIRELAQYIGVRFRYSFLRFVKVPKSLDYLRGNSDDGANNLSHGCINTLIGLPIVFLIILGLAYLYFTFLN